MPKNKTFTTFEHTADVGLRVEADDLEGLFEAAAEALVSQFVEDLEDIRPIEGVEIELVEPDLSYRLFDWLNEILYQCGTRKLALASFEVTLDGDRLLGKARGEPLDPGRHRLGHEVKAITYHGLKVERRGEGWMAEIIVDI